MFCLKKFNFFIVFALTTWSLLSAAAPSNCNDQLQDTFSLKVDTSLPHRYSVIDPINDKFFFHAQRTSAAELTFTVNSRNQRGRSQFLNARREFHRMMEYFDSRNIRTIKAIWIKPMGRFEISTNLDALNDFLNNHFSGIDLSTVPPKELQHTILKAAQETWTGQRSLEYGFTPTSVDYDLDDLENNNFTQIIIRFSR